MQKALFVNPEKNKKMRISIESLKKGNEVDMPMREGEDFMTKAIRYNKDNDRFELYNFDTGEVSYSYTELEQLLKHTNRIFGTDDSAVAYGYEKGGELKSHNDFSIRLYETEDDFHNSEFSVMEVENPNFDQKIEEFTALYDAEQQASDYFSNNENYAIELVTNDKPPHSIDILIKEDDNEENYADGGEIDRYEGKIEKIKAELSKLKGLSGRSPDIFIRDGLLKVSAEDGEDFADYYGEFRGGYPYIDKRLEKIADKYDTYWEWDNPGVITLFPPFARGGNVDKNPAHYSINQDNQIYVDSNFINMCQGVLPKSELKHYGFGDFYLETPEGNVDFYRTDFRIKGFVGRTHRVGGNSVFEGYDLLNAMIKEGKVVKVKDERYSKGGSFLDEKNKYEGGEGYDRYRVVFYSDGEKTVTEHDFLSDAETDYFGYDQDLLDEHLGEVSLEGYGLGGNDYWVEIFSDRYSQSLDDPPNDEDGIDMDYFDPDDYADGGVLPKDIKRVPGYDEKGNKYIDIVYKKAPPKSIGKRFFDAEKSARMFMDAVEKEGGKAKIQKPYDPKGDDYAKGGEIQKLDNDLTGYFEQTLEAWGIKNPNQYVKKVGKQKTTYNFKGLNEKQIGWIDHFIRVENMPY